MSTLVSSRSTGSALAADPRAALGTRAIGYSALPWTKDPRWFSAVLPSHVLSDAVGVLDLGCGPGHLASWVHRHSQACYVGLDDCDAMLAQASASSEGSVRFIAGDIERHRCPEFDDWIFVAANVLHYLRDPQSLASLPQRFGRPRLMCVAQTESFDTETLAWARELFEIVRPGYRRHWHVAGDVDRFVDQLDVTVESEEIVHQVVRFDMWLDGWRLDERARAAARRHFNHAPDAVRATASSASERLMIRRQRVIRFKFR